ncbi:MAG: Plug domain-containing protein, partial [Beijerinckiaceae bacterium]|nr:Plug domain-containing protein [Beijerinckiaceae bacterium]
MPIRRPCARFAAITLPFLLMMAGNSVAIELPEVEIPADSPIARKNSAAQSALAQPGTMIVIDRSYAPVMVVPRSEIELEQYKTLGDALMNKPGLSGTTFAPLAANRPIIRGLDNFRVRIQENGTNAGDVSALGEDHPVAIDPLASQQIEVIRGPATLRYGSEAIGGVVS